MIISNDVKIKSISWLSSQYGEGKITFLYEPESVEELQELCCSFFSSGIKFDLIGHSSNTLYSPGYCCERMVSTRKCNKYEFKGSTLTCECGTPVRQLSLDAIKRGIVGFEGLVDLPGTVASAIYGHATCYNCDISSLLVEAKVLTSDGCVLAVKPDWFNFRKRSSSLKRGEKEAVILTLTLRCEYGDPKLLKSIADKNHASRKGSQPEARNSLGSIFRNHGRPTLLGRLLLYLTVPYVFTLKLIGKDKKEIDIRRRHVILVLLGARDVEPYLRTWNWYQWNDEKSHILFWKYVKVHKKLFTNNEFEIEVKADE